MKYTAFRNKSIVYDAQTHVYPINNAGIFDVMYIHHSKKIMTEG